MELFPVEGAKRWPLEVAQREAEALAVTVAVGVAKLTDRLEHLEQRVLTLETANANTD